MTSGSFQLFKLSYIFLKSQCKSCNLKNPHLVVKFSSPPKPLSSPSVVFKVGNRQSRREVEEEKKEKEVRAIEETDSSYT